MWVAAYVQARSLMEFSNKVIELGRQGVTDFRGRTNSIARAHNAQIAEEERASREAARTADRCFSGYAPCNFVDAVLFIAQ